MGEQISGMNNPLDLIFVTETKKKQHANKDYQKKTKDTFQALPKEHRRNKITRRFVLISDTYNLKIQYK